MESKITIKGHTFEVMIPAERIRAAVEAVAEKINRDYGNDDEVVLLGILNGSFIFMSDLVRLLNFDVEMSFVKLASYRGQHSTGSVHELIGVNEALEGRNVIVVEDIVDSGRSIDHTLEMLRGRGVASVRVCTLFFKPAAFRGVSTIDYAAMEIGNEFIVGYGLDLDGHGRQLKDIYVTYD